MPGFIKGHILFRARRSRLAVIALLAMWLPAARAAKDQPMQALGVE